MSSLMSFDRSVEHASRDKSRTGRCGSEDFPLNRPHAPYDFPVMRLDVPVDYFFNAFSQLLTSTTGALLSVTESTIRKRPSRATS